MLRDWLKGRKTNNFLKCLLSVEWSRRCIHYRVLTGNTDNIGSLFNTDTTNVLFILYIHI